MSGRSTLIPFVPPSAPFTTEQRAWLNGYLAGLFGSAEWPAVLEQAPSSAPKPLLILYGSQTGTAEALAKRIGKEASRRNYLPRVLEMSKYNEVNFSDEQRLLLVTSTWGDGDPPDNAVAFWSHLNSSALPDVSHLGFSVLALGDRNYANFCGAGRKFDERLEQLGAIRIHPRADCDTDYERTAQAWLESFWPSLEKLSCHPLSTIADGSPEVSSLPSVSPGSSYSRSNPFPATLLASVNLNAAGSAKETRHLEFSLHGSALRYEPGDALGVMACNCPELVNDIIEALGCDGEEAVPDCEGKETSFRTALLRHYQITSIPSALLETAADRSNDSVVRGLLAPDNRLQLDKFLFGRDVLDLLRTYPALFSCPKELVGFLRKLQPRLYSISSSPKAHPGEVHITVGALRYESHNRPRKGVCSIFLSERLAIGSTAPVFIQPSAGFKLPQDSDLPIIMIGPGTGIAPFRAFLEERQASGAKGKSWLFFGDQRRATDFLYCEQIERLLKDGNLTRLDMAFSRDQEEKVYVQHRMIENAQVFWDWLEEGAHVYVCGDAKRMAKDVESALHEVISKAGGKTPDQTAACVAALKSQKRYQRDVY